jgi:hypothetical protein
MLLTLVAGQADAQDPRVPGVESQPPPATPQERAIAAIERLTGRVERA